MTGDAITGTQGDCSSPPLKTEIYSVTIVAAGFKSQMLTGIRVPDRLNFDFKVAVGDVRLVWEFAPGRAAVSKSEEMRREQGNG